MVLGSLISNSYNNLTGISEDTATEIALNQASGSDSLEVLNSEDNRGYYRVNLEDVGNGNLVSHLVTKDGKYVSRSFTEIDSNSGSSNFTQCFVEDSAIYGNSSQRETIVQLSVFEEQSRVSQVYRDVNNETVLQEASNRGVTVVPSIYSDGRVLSGVNSLDRIREFTGCN